MAQYVVTAALVQVPATQVDGSKALTYSYRGAVIDLAKSDDLAKHLLGLGMIAPVEDVADDPVVAEGPAQVAAALAAADVTARPADDADDEVWIAHAVRSGLPEDDARKADREDLIAIFGDQSPTRRTRRRAAKAEESPAEPPAEQPPVAEQDATPAS